MAPQPRPLLLAPLLAASLAAMPLGMAQTAVDGGGAGGSTGTAAGTPAPAPVAPPPAAPAAAPEPSGPAPAAALEPERAPASPPASPAAAKATVRLPESPARILPPRDGINAPGPLLPGREQRTEIAAPRFDGSLDALLRDGVVTPKEVRIHRSIAPGNTVLRLEGCRSGAFSARECGLPQPGTGVLSRFEGETDGGGGGGAPYASPGATVSRGERFGIDAAPLPPIAVPVTALLSGIGGRFRLTDVFQVTPRPGGLRGNGNTRMIFPLIGEAATTSNFGWRLHPILGTWMMHSGRDLAAPEGTPVVAALAGRVVSSGEAGGYGLAIEVEHDNPRRRTLYGHLSELYVKEGERVKQGEVIGRVGSTGRSTGPHLHFELRVPQEGGWVAVEPGDLDPAGAAAEAVAGLPGLEGLAGLSQAGGAPPDALALLLGQLIQSLERPRAPGEAPPAAVPLPTDRLPQRLPASARLPGPAPLPRSLPSAATPGR